MLLYIDPGTGSMLFTILIGILGVAQYFLKNLWVKLRFFSHGGGGCTSLDKSVNKQPLVIFSDDKRYWSIFAPVIQKLDEAGFPVHYYTASEDDAAFCAPFSYMKAEFLGSGNRSFAKLRFLKAYIVLATTPGLDVLQWKRSPEVDWYVHLPHMATDLASYRMFGLDYYDAILISGAYQEEQARELEALRGLPPKEIELVGIPYMDEMKRRLEEAPPLAAHLRTVLLAPSWGPSSIFNRFGEAVIDHLLALDIHLIIRPHPQSFASERALMERLMKRYPASNRLEWNRDADNFEVLRRADILISDFSGVMFDFALVYDKPIIYTDTHFDPSPYDAWWLDKELWKFRVLPWIGRKLTKETLGELGEMIENCISSDDFAKGREKAREECWAYQGESAARVAAYLMKKYEALKEKESEEKR